MFTWIELFNVSIKWKFTLCKCKLILGWKRYIFFLVTYAGLLQSFSLATRSHSPPSNDQPIYKTQSLPCILFFFSNQFPSDVCHNHNKVFFHPQVNAQVLVSSFSPDSHQWILLGQSMGRVLKACTASKEVYSQVHVTALGRWSNSIRARLLLCSRGTFYWIVVVLLFWELFCY